MSNKPVRAWAPFNWGLPVACGLTAALAGTALASGLLRPWALALVLGVYLVVGSVPLSFRLGAGKRVALFFGLLALSDFLKRLVFLAPDQDPWSQYVAWLFPHIYFAIFVLAPWILYKPGRAATAIRYGWPVGAFIVIALVNTWLAPGFGLVSRLAASLLLIMPWTMVFVAASYPDALVPVWRVIIASGLLSALYAFWQFVSGPTPVELNWALATSGFSIGATHLAWVVEGVPGFWFWRVVGFQADSFTFGMFMVTALAGLFLLRAARALGRTSFVLGSLTFSLAVLVSLVRTVWVSWAAFLLSCWLFYRVRYIRNPWLTTFVVVAMFLGAGPLADYVYSSAPRLALNNPVLQRAFTVGTLEARRHALEALLSNLPGLWLFGYGYAASDWITSKFGREVALPPNFAAHNGFVELLWYTGLPGLVVFLIFIYILFRSVQSAWPVADGPTRRMLGASLAYIVAVLVSGLGNGGAFWGYYLFFAAGSILGTTALRVQAGQPPGVKLERQ
mgnify:CR=1 FL=1